MKPRPDTFHIPPTGELPCVTYQALTDRELLELREAWPTADHYQRMSILRRVAQGIEGMTTPAPERGPTYEAARKAVNLFVLWTVSEQAASHDLIHRQLHDLLGITQPELLAA